MLSGTKQKRMPGELVWIKQSTYLERVSELKRMRQRILSFGKYLVLVLSVILMFFLSAVSLVSTAYFNKENFGEESKIAEHVYYRTDSLALNLLAVAFIVLILYFINRKFGLEKIPTKVLAAAAVFYTILVSVLWMFAASTYPQADQENVSTAAYLMYTNNYLFLKPGGYLQMYPHQMGLAAVMEAVYCMAGGEYWKCFMFLNAISNGGIVFFLYRITDKLFHSKRVCNLVLLLSMGCVQLILYTTFLYGITLGLALSLAAFWMLLLYFEKDRLKFAFLAAVLTGAAILVKSNYSIFLIMLVILLCYKGLELKKIRPVLIAFILIVTSFLMKSALLSFYEFRSEMEISDGMPKSLWIAMGMQEGERAEGWYNGFNTLTFWDSGCDIPASDAIAKEAIQASLQKFRDNPGYALQFYYKKIVSQWNEPTYECQWVNRFHCGKFPVLVQSIYDGKLYTVLYEYMNVYQSLVYCMVLASLFFLRKTWKIEQLGFLIVVLGGFLFHILWEAKSQYIYPYLIILFPYAAAGISGCINMLDAVLAGKLSDNE